MSFGKIKIRKSDKLFREYLLKLRGERCEHCGRTGRVEVSHFFGRRSEAIRYSEANCQLLCSGCHRIFHERPLNYVEWLKKRMGEKEFNRLTLFANTYQKRDDKLAEIYWKKCLEKLNKE